MSNQNGLLSSKDVAATGDVDSNFFIRKGETIIVDDIIANNITCDTLDLNGGLLTTTTGGTVLTLNGVPITGGVATITGTAPINVTSGANPVVSLNDTAVVPATYTLATVTVDSKGRITSASSNTVPPNDDWSNFPAQTAVNMNNFKITTLATPTVATDASTKGYVDSNFVALTGNQTISGIKTFNSIPVCATLPTNNDQLANKQYVDAAVGADALVNVLIAGNSAGANQINMNSNKIINCADPTLAQDVATKAYVDARPTETLAATLIAGNSAGANQINMNSNKIINLATPTLTTDAVTKAYVDGVITTVPTLTTVMNAGNVAPRDLDMNDFDISSVNDITMSGLAPTITATNVLGNMILSASNTMNLATIGQMTLASGGILSLGGATYTTLEDIRITDNAITKESGAADITIADVASITNTGSGSLGNMLIQSEQNLTLNSTAGAVVVEGVTVNGTTITSSGLDITPAVNTTATITTTGTGDVNINSQDQINIRSEGGTGFADITLFADDAISATCKGAFTAGSTLGITNIQGTTTSVTGATTGVGATIGNLTLGATNTSVGNDVNINTWNGDTVTPAVVTRMNVDSATNGNITMTNNGTGWVQINSASATSVATMKLQNTASTSAPVNVEFNMNKTVAGATNDNLTNLIFTGKDNANNKQEYARFQVTTRDATANSTNGSINVRVAQNMAGGGSTTEIFRFNGLDGQNESLVALDMNTNDVLNIARISLTQGGAGFGQSGQSLISNGGGIGNTYNYKMIGWNIGTGGATTIDSSSFNDIFGNIPINLTNNSFVRSPSNKYRITVNGTFSGVNDTVKMLLQVSSGVGGNVEGLTFNGSADLYYYATAQGPGGNSFITYSFSDIVDTSSNPLNMGGVCYVYCLVQTLTGSHTINNNRHSVMIEPVYG